MFSGRHLRFTQGSYRKTCKGQCSFNFSVQVPMSETITAYCKRGRRNITCTVAIFRVLAADNNSNWFQQQTITDVYEHLTNSSRRRYSAWPDHKPAQMDTSAGAKWLAAKQIVIYSCRVLPTVSGVCPVCFLISAA